MLMNHLLHSAGEQNDLHEVPPSKIYISVTDHQWKIDGLLAFNLAEDSHAFLFLYRIDNISSSEVCKVEG